MEATTRTSPVPVTPPAATLVPCTATGKRPQESDFSHCPSRQGYVRCGPHHRADLNVLDTSDVSRLHDLWSRYRDDLTWPWYELKPKFNEEDFDTFFEIAQKVVEAMVKEFQQPMVLDQATISNTNHRGHPPHADNLQFDSVWWKGKRIRKDDELVAAREGAYVLWRPEKTSYRSYSCTVSLADPAGFEGGEVRFFRRWGEEEPVETRKCQVGTGVAFCGCQRNIHAVGGVRRGFRLVFLVWTRPPHVRVPDGQAHVCYFRPGTGLGCWLTTADMMHHRSQKRKRSGLAAEAWMPIESDNGCMCEMCAAERLKLSWKDRFKYLANPAACTPTTSAGNSPRPASQEDGTDSPHTESMDVTVAADDDNGETSAALKHCPLPQGIVSCKNHVRRELHGVVSRADMQSLRRLWESYKDDLSNPWYKEKPVFAQHDFITFRRIANKVVIAMGEALGEQLALDQATISCTGHQGHPPHADNVQFDSAWWRGRQIRQSDELTAVREGATALFKASKTSYRNYSASVALSTPSGYKGGDLEFYSSWGQRDPDTIYRCEPGDGVAFCGCQKTIHAVTGVRQGERLVLLVWTRPIGVEVPEDQRHVCYFRPGTGLGVWLTTADLLRYGSEKTCPVRGKSVVGTLGEPATVGENQEEEDEEEAFAEGRWWWWHHGWSRDRQGWREWREM